MLTYEDCLGLGHVDEDEIRAIAEHEHIPEIIALELAEYLLHDENGVPAIRKIILEDMDEARRAGKDEHAEKLRLVLAHFLATHPSRAAT